MKLTRLLMVLTFINMALLVSALMRSRSVAAQGVAPVLRGRALEILDDHGRVRASIKVLPGDATAQMPDGTTGYPETVLLRMITSKGRPNVKLAAKEDGAVLALGGESDPTYVQILAEGTGTSLKLSDKDGRDRVIKP